MAKHFTFASHEALLWEGIPRQIINLKFFALYGFGLLVCLFSIFSFTFFAFVGIAVFSFLIFDKYVMVRDTKYDLTHERLRIVKGGLMAGRKTYDIDIHDLRDVELHEPFFHQIFGLGIMVLIFKGDPTSEYRELFEKNYHIMNGLSDSAKSREIIRTIIKPTTNKQSLTAHEYDLNVEKRQNTPKLLK